MKKITFTFFMSLVFILGHAQAPNIQWEKSLGGSGTDIAYCVRQTSDGGYILVGETNSTDGDVTANNGTTDFWVAKLDANGALQWQKALGGSGDDRGYSVAPTADGGYIVAGASNSTNGDVSGGKGLYDFWVVKLTSTGTITWQKMLGGTGIDEARSVAQTTDGGYVVTGWIRSNNLDVTLNNGGSDYWIVKLDATGAITWQKSLGGTGDDTGNSIQQTADGGYIVAGETISTNGDVTGNNGGTDYWVVKLNSTGTTIDWKKCYGGTGIDKAKSIHQTTDGGYIIAGTAASTNGNITLNNGLENPWIVKVSATGTIEWQKCFGGMFYDAANSIQPTADGGYIFAGNVSSNNADVSGNHGGDDIWVVKLNTTGTLQWQKCLGGTGSDIAFAVQQTTDNGYILAGKSNSAAGDRTSPKGLVDFWAVKLVGVPTNTAGTGLNNLSFEENLLMFPNPSSGQLTIRNAGHPSLAEGFQIQLLNTLGEIVYDSDLQREEISIYLSNRLVRGIYFVTILDSQRNRMLTRKWIME